MTGETSSLDTLGIKHNTDKSSRFVTKEGQDARGHDYLRHYEIALHSLSTSSPTILDLGAGYAHAEWASALTWKEFLPSSRVVVVDIRTPDAKPPDGVEFVRGDLGDLAFLTHLGTTLRPDFICEDASHWWSHQILSMVYLLPTLSSGGIYVWEDLQVSRPSMATEYGKGLRFTPVQFLDMIANEMLLNGRAPKPTKSEFDGVELGITEILAVGLAQLVDSITIVRESAMLRRR